MAILLGVLAVPLVLFTLYSGLAFTWSYPDGERAGILQKFSRKGWVCKTYEGELAMSIVPGVTPTIWECSARDERVVPRLSQAIGKRVVLHYAEHPGIPQHLLRAHPLLRGQRRRRALVCQGSAEQYGRHHHGEDEEHEAQHRDASPAKGPPASMAHVSLPFGTPSV